MLSRYDANCAAFWPQVTPLWCAAVANHLDIVKMLADYGADINATSDSQSTPVRSACFMTNLEVAITTPSVLEVAKSLIFQS